MTATGSLRTGQKLTAVYAARVPTQRVLKHIREESIVVHQLFVTDETPARALITLL